MSDPPDHTRLRRLVSARSARVRSSACVPPCSALVDELLDTMADSGDVDFMAEFALPLPMAVIGELVGVPGGGPGGTTAPRTGRGQGH